MIHGKMFRNYRQSLGLISAIAINILLLVLFFSSKLLNTSLISPSVTILCLVIFNIIFWQILIFNKNANNANERIFKEFAENLNEVFWRVTPDLSQTIYVSPAYDEIWGKSSDNLYKKPNEWFESIIPEDQEMVKDTFLSLRQEEVTNVAFEFKIKHPNGELRQIYTRGFKFKNEKGELINILGISTDITAYKKQQQVNTILNEIKNILDFDNHLAVVTPKVLKIICTAHHWDFGEMWLVDRETNVLRSISLWENSEWDNVNKFGKKSQRITFRPGITLPGKVWELKKIIWIEDLETENLVRINEAQEAGFHSAIGIPIFVDNNIIGVMDFFSQNILKPDKITKNLLNTISDLMGQYIEKKHSSDQLIYASRHDAQTSLLNRSALKDNLKHLLVSTNKLAILLVKIDRLSLINSLIGYESSDLLLKMVVDRFRKITPKLDEQIGRYETNLFVFYSPFQLVDEIIQFSQTILRLFNEPFLINQQYIYLSANIGISTNSDSGNDPNALFRNANFALDKSIKSGKNNFNFFTSELSDVVQEQLILEASLENALNNNEFCLYYQPKLSLTTGEITGIEALVRWQHPVKGLLQPADFISLAEETGLITQLQKWVFREIFTVIKNNCPVNPNGKGLIAINISPQHFNANYDIFSYIKSLMQEFNVNPKLIEIEITENVHLEGSQYNLTLLNKLISMGFNLSLDDFGTGCNSLNYLLQIPANSIKIDKSFIDGLPNNINSIAIVRSVITLCHTLDKKVIAEGVERLEQLEFLKQEGCDEIQGYYFSRPLPINELKKFISEHKKWI